MPGVYIHIPFCISKCAYCDFASFPGIVDQQARYASALMREMRLRADVTGPFDTLYFGGGTPSLLSPDIIAGLIGEVRVVFGLTENAEITIEANPATFDASKAGAWRKAGVNRVSMGAQSSCDGLLKRLGRAHVWSDVVSGVRVLRGSGFDNLSLDLMFGLPGQTPENFCETLSLALELDPEHLSCYALKVEEGTQLARDLALGRLDLPDEDALLEMMGAMETLLPSAGLARYEISNFARHGRESRHNLNYWRNGTYVGLGVSAHGRVGMTRFSNTCNFDAYVRALEGGACAAQETTISPEDEAFETSMLALRLSQGLDLQEYSRRCGCDFMAGREKSANKLRALGLLDWDTRAIWVTNMGMRLQNSVLVELL